MYGIEDLLAGAAGNAMLLKSSHENIRLVLGRPDCAEWERASITELVERKEWSELNDRFYRTLEFGTGGLRGRTIGKIVTRAEQGNGTPDVPQYPAVGTNTVNFFTVAVATHGLMSYLVEEFPAEEVRVAISYDTRLFSPEYARLAAAVVSEHGGVAHVFGDVRPTPELSFAVRRLRAHAGIMITASHNPSHDNGYKVYFRDGAQIVEPQASDITSSVLAAQQGEYTGLPPRPGRIQPIDTGMDNAYISVLKGLVLRPDVLEQRRSRLKVVYTPLHGTGVTIIPRLLTELGVGVLVVPEQAACDGRFPTVKSPNPENPDALALAVKLAAEVGADAVIATDPDCDRMGVAVRSPAGDYRYLTGNQIGSVISHYRIEQLVAQGVLTPENSGHAALIKTLVTTDLIRSIADAHGLKCVETLTGFKHIGAKLRHYEEEAGGAGERSAAEWRDILLRRSTYCVFAAEESYGYLAEDYVRDKDAAGAALVFIELLAFANQQGTTVLEMLDRIYLEHGYYGERLETLTFEGEEGAGKISALLESYDTNPPDQWAGKRVTSIRNYATQNVMDVDGIPMPRELMLTFRLADGCSVTTRASGTEPKIKFYFSAVETATSAQELSLGKQRIESTLDRLGTFTRADVKCRIGD